MKKLLRLLSISTLTASLPTPLLANANAPLTRVKRDVSTLTSNSNSDYLPLKQISGISGVLSITVDKTDNVYFGTKNGAFVLKNGETTPTKINGVGDYVYFITPDNDNNLYVGTAGDSAYKLPAGSNTPTKIDDIGNYVNSVGFDKNNNVYFGTNKGIFVLKQGSTTPSKIDGIDGIEGLIYSIVSDKLDNIYFGGDKGIFVLKQGSTTPSKIDAVTNRINSIAIDKLDNIYFGGTNGIFVLKQGSTTPTKINIGNNILSIIVDSKDNDVYIGTSRGAYKLSAGSNTASKINGIEGLIYSIVSDNKHYLYFGTNDGAYVVHSALTSLEWTKQQSQFNLVDNNKTTTWTRPDLIAVDDELNIEIANPNIDKVVFDNVQQSQTNKQWKINVKPETSEKDHNLQVFFTLDGKQQYTSEITVSMQAKIAPPKPIVKENLDKVIKFGNENNLGNILDNNDSTIEAKIQQINSRIIDFSQIEFDKKDIHSATLSAKPDSKSYQGAVVVKYNLVPATIVDLKIDLQPTASTTQVVKDYVGQIDTSIITSPVNTFSYANSESKIMMLKPTPNSFITGVVYGCDEQWNKTSQHNSIDSTNGVVLDGSQLATSGGKYVVELSDNLGHTNNIYLQISPKQAIPNYFDTDNGKQFAIWAKANGRDDIRGYNARQLNKLFTESKKWQQLAGARQFAHALADWFKTNGKLAAKEPLTKEQVIAQLQTQMPKNITIDKFDTSNYDFKKVEFELNQNEIKPNEKVNITVLYDSEKSDNFTLQIENNNPLNNNKSGLTGWAIIGVIIGALSGLLLHGWLLKKFVITPFILEPIRKKKAEAFQRQTEKDIAQMKAEEKEEQEKNK